VGKVLKANFRGGLGFETECIQSKPFHMPSPVHHPSPLSTSELTECEKQQDFTVVHTTF
jgi:hypothetical protein